LPQALQRALVVALATLGLIIVGVIIGVVILDDGTGLLILDNGALVPLTGAAASLVAVIIGR
jgi:hypothetical protein